MSRVSWEADLEFSVVVSADAGPSGVENLTVTLGDRDVTGLVPQTVLDDLSETAMEEAAGDEVETGELVWCCRCGCTHEGGWHP